MPGPGRSSATTALEGSPSSRRHSTTLSPDGELRHSLVVVERVPSPADLSQSVDSSGAPLARTVRHLPDARKCGEAQTFVHAAAHAPAIASSADLRTFTSYSSRVGSLAHAASIVGQSIPEIPSPSRSTTPTKSHPGVNGTRGVSG